MSTAPTSVWASTPPIPKEKRPIIMAGPSGVGKSTLLTKLFQEFPNDFGFSVSHTTRDPRPGEVRGQSYHYVTHAEFESLIAQGAFLEHAQFGGNRYGTTAKAVADVTTTSSRRAILDIDAQGVKLIKANHASLNPIFIFVSPPSFSTLKLRLTARGTETEQSIAKRLSMAGREMEFARQKGAFDWVIVNDDLQRAYAKLKSAIDGTLKQGEDDPMPPKDSDEDEWMNKHAP